MLKPSHSLLILDLLLPFIIYTGFTYNNELLTSFAYIYIGICCIGMTIVLISLNTGTPFGSKILRKRKENYQYRLYSVITTFIECVVLTYVGQHLLALIYSALILSIEIHTKKVKISNEN